MKSVFSSDQIPLTSQSSGRVERFVIIVTEKEESKALEGLIGSHNWVLHDLVLDDGSWLTDTMVVGSRAFAVLIGGHTVFQFFRDVPQLEGRAVTHSLQLEWRHGTLLLGWWLRRQWARKIGANLVYPDWRAKI